MGYVIDYYLLNWWKGWGLYANYKVVSMMVCGGSFQFHHGHIVYEWLWFSGIMWMYECIFNNYWNKLSKGLSMALTIIEFVIREFCIKNTYNYIIHN